MIFFLEARSNFKINIGIVIYHGNNNGGDVYCGERLR